MRIELYTRHTEGVLSSSLAFEMESISCVEFSNIWRGVMTSWTVKTRGGQFCNRLIFCYRFTTESTTEFDSVNGVTGSNSVVNLLWFEKKKFFLQQNYNRFWLCEFIHRLKFCCISVAFVEDLYEVLYWKFEFWNAFWNVIIWNN